LRAGCVRAAPFGDLRAEDPQLLDPADPDDPGLLWFDIEGRAVPAPSVKDVWDRQRVEYSVSRYNLDFPPLIEKRRAVWSECSSRIEEYRAELERYYADKQNDVARAGFKRAAKSVRDMMGEDEELSGVARACVLSTGDPRVIGLLRAA
jgi:hypothetical protein